MINSLKYKLKLWAQQFDWFYQIRFSNWYLNYSLKKDKNRQNILQKEVKMYTKALSFLKKSPQLIFDVGANEGYTIDAFLPTNAHIIAVEPDQRNGKILHTRFSKNPQITFVAKAVSKKIGTAIFHTNYNGALNTLNLKWHQKMQNAALPKSKSYEVETTTLDILIAKYGAPDFIKIDVEGHEMEVIEGLSQAVPLLSFEANLPDFLEETLACLEKLAALNSAGVFNFTHDFEWIFEDFVDLEKAKRFVTETDKTYLEVFFISPQKNNGLQN
jgi:FkbM family methyltransferase